MFLGRQSKVALKQVGVSMKLFGSQGLLDCLGLRAEGC